MAETKFTPGPWTVARIHSNGNWLSMIVGDCKPIAEVNCDCLEASDAHLIAAAPDLYEALEEIVENAVVYYEGSMDIYSEAIENARNAMAKARGEES